MINILCSLHVNSILKLNAIKAMTPYVAAGNSVAGSVSHGHGHGADLYSSCKDMMEEMKAILQA